MLKALFCTYLVAAAALCAQETSPRSSAAGSLSGRVVDIDGNGIPGAEIQLGRQRASAFEELFGLKAVTGDDGAFKFEGLDPGVYVLQAKSGKLQIDPYEMPSYELRKGQNLTGVRLSLFEPSVVTGMVTDEDGDPVQGAVIEVLQYMRRGGRRMLAARTGATTDDRGVYRIANVYPGRIYLRATTSSPMAANRYPPTYFPSSPDLDHARPLDATGRKELGGINLLLRGTPTHAVRGKLQSDGPIASLSFLELLPTDPTAPIVVARATARGTSFEFQGIAPGDYIVSLGNGGGIRIVQPGDPEGPAVGRTTVHVGDADVNDVVVPVSAGGSVSGTVRFEDGTPVAARITLIYTGVYYSLTGNPLVKSVQSDATGQFSLAGLIPGQYSVVVSAPSDWTYLKSLNSRDVTLSAPAILTIDGSADLKIVLSQYPASVSGSVQGAKEGLVVLWPAARDVPWNPESVQVTQLDADAHFAIHGVAPGAYNICAWDYIAGALNALAADREFLSQIPQCTSLTLEEDSSPVVDLTPLDRQLTEQAIAKSR